MNAYFERIGRHEEMVALRQRARSYRPRPEAPTRVPEVA